MKKVYLIVIALVLLAPIVWYLASPLFIDKTVNEEFPIEGTLEENLEVNLSSEERVNVETKQDTSDMISHSGDFMDADSFHKVSGKAKIISDGVESYLRLEDFQATNGPDLYVYLSTDTGASDFVSLGRLKGNVGNQNYELSEDVDLEKYDNVLIWCKRFSTLFGSADLDEI